MSFKFPDIRKPRVVIGVLLVCFLIGIVPRRPIDDFVYKRAVAALSSKGVDLSAERFHINFPLGFSAENVTVIVKVGPFPLQLFLKKLSAVVPITRLLVLSPEVNATAELYGGLFTLQTSKSLLSGGVSSDVKLENFSLSEFPITKAAGGSGLLTIRSTGTQSSAAGAQGSLRVNGTGLALQELAVPGGFVRIPQFEKGIIRVEALSNGGELTITAADFDSSLGTVRSSGTAKRVEEKLSGLLSGEIKLTESGVSSELGKWAQLLSGVQTARDFTFTVPLDRPQQGRIVAK